jgi:hypothetical protein
MSVTSASTAVSVEQFRHFRGTVTLKSPSVVFDDRG